MHCTRLGLYLAIMHLTFRPNLIFTALTRCIDISDTTGNFFSYAWQASRVCENRRTKNIFYRYEFNPRSSRTHTHTHTQWPCMKVWYAYYVYRLETHQCIMSPWRYQVAAYPPYRVSPKENHYWLEDTQISILLSTRWSVLSPNQFYYLSVVDNYSARKNLFLWGHYCIGVWYFVNTCTIFLWASFPGPKKEEEEGLETRL